MMSLFANRPAVSARSAIPIAFAALFIGSSGGSPAVTAVDYTIRVDSAAGAIAVEMRVHNAPAVFRIAMATHTEYDDQYWRYLTGLHGTSVLGAVSIAREDSSLWRVNGPAGDVVLGYRVQFPESPPLQQASWKAHLRPNGGLIGGPHSFLYVVGAEQARVRLALQLPRAWNVATGLEQSGSPGTFTAPDAVTLIDSPIMVGTFRRWRFSIDGIAHGIAFLGTGDGTAFDTTQLVSNVERLARAAARAFSPMPYGRYEFLFEDGATGGLEHVNSVSIGVRSANLARDPSAYLVQIAHEFFHTWNEVHIRPASWIGVRYVPPTPTGELWFSEGVTLYYADLLLRRAGLPTPDSTRIARLERLMAQYLANPSHAAVAPERTSLAFNMQAATGDYTPSMFTQGDLIGTVLDLMIRERSAGERSLDDVVRALAAEFSPSRGIRGADIERAVARACACDPHPFFATHVSNARPLDFDRWLSVLGLRSDVSWSPARAADGSLLPDRRVSGFLRPGETQPRLQIWFPATVWGRSGFHTGDRITAWNGVAVDSLAQLRTLIAGLGVGDTVRLAVQRDVGPFEATVTVGGYERPTVRISPRGDATAEQRALLARWLVGDQVLPE
jgi:predicted metalloprotease with PDZ domain